MNKKIFLLIPLIGLFIVGGILVKGIVDIQRKTSLSFETSTPMPSFDLPPIPGFEKGLSNADLLGKVSLVNIWGSWCVTCEYEHPILLELAAKTNIPLYGIDWREEKPENGSRWLKRKGNPYTQIGADPRSELAIQLGITGAPETLVVDKKGIIRWHHEGALNWDILNKELLPLVEKLKEEE